MWWFLPESRLQGQTVQHVCFQICVPLRKRGLSPKAAVKHLLCCCRNECFQKNIMGFLWLPKGNHFHSRSSRNVHYITVVSAIIEMMRYGAFGWRWTVDASRQLQWGRTFSRKKEAWVIPKKIDFTKAQVPSILINRHAKKGSMIHLHWWILLLGHLYEVGRQSDL